MSFVKLITTIKKWGTKTVRVRTFKAKFSRGNQNKMNAWNKNRFDRAMRKKDSYTVTFPGKSSKMIDLRFPFYLAL